MSYGNAFAIEYFSSMAGFIDGDAEIAFLVIVKGAPLLLAANSVYKKIYGKLENPGLKAQ